MSLLHWDLKCVDCGTVFDEIFKSVDDRDWWLAHGYHCHVCPGRLEVLPPDTNFELKGKGWPGKEEKQ